MGSGKPCGFARASSGRHPCHGATDTGNARALLAKVAPQPTAPERPSRGPSKYTKAHCHQARDNLGGVKPLVSSCAVAAGCCLLFGPNPPNTYSRPSFIVEKPWFSRGEGGLPSIKVTDESSQERCLTASS